MKTHNFTIGVVDTDSISFCKYNGAPFSTEELDELFKEINDMSPEFIEWEEDGGDRGLYKSCLALKAKNYVLYDGNKKIVKGSAFKTSSKEPAMKELMTRVVDAVLNDKQEELLVIYNSYIKEAINVKDISRWSQKKSVTEAILKCRGYEKYTKEQLEKKEIRKNETNPWDAVKMEELIQQGDKFYTYPAILASEIQKIEKTLKSGEVKVKEKTIYSYGLRQPKHWNGVDQDVEQLLQRCFDTMSIFETVLQMDKFLNYSLVKNKPLLKNILTNRVN